MNDYKSWKPFSNFGITNLDWLKSKNYFILNM